MEFTEIAALVGALMSVASVFVSFRLTSERMKAERDLINLFHEKLSEDKKLRARTIKIINRKPGTELKSADLVEYEKVLLNLLEQLPKEDRVRIYPAIMQSSSKGRISYISKLISNEAKNASSSASAA